jgi:hypothetical protein
MLTLALYAHLPDLLTCTARRRTLALAGSAGEYKVEYEPLSLNEYQNQY